MAIDKDKFTSVLLNGNGTPAVGPFPANMPCGGDAVHTDAYNAEQAKKLLREAGWTDTDGNGYVDKNGQDLTVRWLTYTSRQELPLLAEAAQAFLKEVGIRAEVNATDNYNDFLQATRSIILRPMYWTVLPIIPATTIMNGSKN